jgi:hypothetical protein
VNLQRGIAARSGEFLLFAVTPPRLTTSPQEAAEIARVTQERLRPLGIDGLVLYDIDDESDRYPDERPFPFLPTMDPADRTQEVGSSNPPSSTKASLHRGNFWLDGGEGGREALQSAARPFATDRSG